MLCYGFPVQQELDFIHYVHGFQAPDLNSLKLNPLLPRPQNYLPDYALH